MRRFTLRVAIVLVMVGMALPLSVRMFADGPARAYIPLIMHTPGQPPPVVATDRWSDPATWQSGHVPVANEAVTIPANRQVLLDVSPPSLKSLTIHGALVFDRQNLSLTADWIALDDGTLAIGSATAPFTNRATITLTADVPAEQVMGMGTRGLL